MWIRPSKNSLLPILILAASSLAVSSAQAEVITGGNGVLAFNATTVSALVGLGFAISADSPATLTGLTVSFPITGGDTTSSVDFSGGLDFTEGGNSVNLTNFILNLSTDKVTATANGTSSIAFLDVGAGAVATLDAATAAAFSSDLGVPNLTGATMGTLTVNATTGAATPEPASLALAAGGLLVTLLARRKN